MDLTQGNNIVERLARIIFGDRVAVSSRRANAELVSYEESITKYGEYHEKLRAEIEEVLHAIDMLGLEIADLARYVPKGKMRLVRRTNPMRRKPRMEVEVEERPKALKRAYAARRRRK